MQSEPSRIEVALMYQAAPMPAPMRAALAALGVDIAYEAAAAAFDVAALKAAGARAVVVSIGDAEDEAFATVDNLLADGYTLIFNDTDVSEALHGFEQARWARHLAAKLHRDPSVLLPERPPGAIEAAAPSLKPVSASPLADVEEAAVATSHQGVPVVVEIASSSLAEFEAAADTSEPAPEHLHEHETVNERASAHDQPQEYELDPAPVAAYAHAQEHDALTDFDSETLTASSTPATSDFASSPASEFDDLEAALAGLDDAHHAAETEHDPGLEFSVSDGAWQAFQAEDINATPVEAAHLPVEDMPLELTLIDEPEPEPELPPLHLEREDKAAALAFADEGLSLEADPALPPLEGTTPLQKSSDWFQGKNEETHAAAPGAARVADDWALLDFDVEIPVPAAVATPIRATITDAPAYNQAPEWDLAPLAVSEETDQVADLAKAAIPRVWVLIGSIGAPEALRDFLGGLPEKIATLLVVVAPIGADFQSALVSQLSKASALPVRVAENGQTASVGEVLLLPQQGRLQIKPDGRLLVGSNEGESMPVVESLLHDLTATFGIRAGVILLSGVVNGAVAACQQVADTGGPIWAQDADNCVVSSMVDSANEAGVVQYSAAPRQLAARLAAICATAE